MLGCYTPSEILNYSDTLLGKAHCYAVAGGGLEEVGQGDGEAVCPVQHGGIDLLSWRWDKVNPQAELLLGVRGGGVARSHRGDNILDAYRDPGCSYGRQPAVRRQSFRRDRLNVLHQEGVGNLFGRKQTHDIEIERGEAGVAPPGRKT